MLGLRALVTALAPATLALAWPVSAGPGPLVIVGGALDPGNAPIYGAILEHRLPGKPICVLPTASGRPKRSMVSYVKDFRRYGGPDAAKGIAITVGKPQRADSPRIATRLEGCGGVFFTGGDQSRIVDVLRPGGKPSPADDAIRKLWALGGVVAGTSAGAAMMSDPMIGGGSSSEAFTRGVTPRQDSLGVWVREGMGFMPTSLVDQHCLARGRLGRLLVAAAEDRQWRFGLCIDEDTALVVEGRRARVVGTSGVAVLDLESAGPASGRGFRGGRLWLLGEGDQLDLASGRATPHPGKEIWAPELSETIITSEDPWVLDAFHRLVVSFSGSTASSIALGEGATSLRLSKGQNFRAYSREDDASPDPDHRGTAKNLFAGPIEIDWQPETAGQGGPR